MMSTGDKVTLTFRGRTVPALVKLASPNGKSLVLEFGALLGDYDGLMPVIYHPGKGYYIDLFHDERVEIAIVLNFGGPDAA